MCHHPPEHCRKKAWPPHDGQYCSLNPPFAFQQRIQKKHLFGLSLRKCVKACLQHYGQFRHVGASILNRWPQATKQQLDTICSCHGYLIDPFQEPGETVNGPPRIASYNQTKRQFGQISSRKKIKTLPSFMLMCSSTHLHFLAHTIRKCLASTISVGRGGTNVGISTSTLFEGLALYRDKTADVRIHEPSTKHSASQRPYSVSVPTPTDCKTTSKSSLLKQVASFDAPCFFSMALFKFWGRGTKRHFSLNLVASRNLRCLLTERFHHLAVWMLATLMTMRFWSRTWRMATRQLSCHDTSGQTGISYQRWTKNGGLNERSMLHVQAKPPLHVPTPFFDDTTLFQQDELARLLLLLETTLRSKSKTMPTVSKILTGLS